MPAPATREFAPHTDPLLGENARIRSNERDNFLTALAVQLSRHSPAAAGEAVDVYSGCRQMPDEFAGVDRQIGLAAHTDRQLAHRPLVGQFDAVDRHCPRVTLGSGRRDDTNPDIAFDETADRIEAAQLHPQSKTPADPLGLFGQEALQCARPIQTDKVEVEGVGKGNPFCRR